MAKVQKKNISKNSRSNNFIIPWLVLGVALLIVFFALFHGRRPEALAKPGSNVLLITLDTTRADHMGYAGHAAARTPNLDRLAAGGVRCEAAYSPVPLTLPAHCSLLSGLYPPAHKVRNNGTYFLPGPVLTLAEILGRRGYRTSAFVSSFVLDSRFGLDQGFTVYDDDFGHGRAKTYTSQRDAAAVFAAFSGWLAGHDEGRFFSWVHFFDPHAPYDPPEPYRSAFRDDPYDGEIAYMDHYVGEIVSLLEKKRLLKNTLIVVAGDHGEAFGEHGENGHQVFCYDENLRVPVIFSAADALPEGMRLRQKASLADVMPTILEYLGEPLPPSVQGRSLLPAMRRVELPERDLYMESFFACEAFHCAPIRGILRGHFKYLDLPRPELYDLQDDPGERKNLVSARAPLGQELKNNLHDLEQRLEGSAMESGRRLSSAEKDTLATLGYITTAPALGSGPLPDPKDKIAGWQAFTKGVEQEAGGETAAAEASLLRAIELIPDYPGSYTILANLYYNSGRGDRALELFGEALARLPADPTLKTEYADLLVRMRRPEQALAQLQELARTELLDKKARVQSLMAGIYEGRGDIPQAIAHYRLALESEPENDDFARRLAYLLHRSARFADALEIYLALERRHPDDPQLVRDMAIVYAQMNELERSRSYFTRALRQAPDANLYFNFALLLARQGEIAEAAAMMKKFLALAPPGSAQAEAGRRHLSSWQGR
jgi:arylsulfatase A-like enzyme/Tfp pilus assembly protein PilF